MARKVDRLKDVTIRGELAPGWYPDGKGLYLQVSPTGTKSWVYRYQDNGKERRHGLGRYSGSKGVSLAEARNKAGDCYKLRKEGRDPIEVARERAEKCRQASGSRKTFEECATQYITAHRAGWRNAKHAAQWINTLTTYAFPVLGKMSVQDIELAHVLRALEAIWYDKPETATRVRQRIEKVLDWATTRGFRNGDNPARWRGHLDTQLPARGKVQKAAHLAALPYTDAPVFLATLRGTDTLAARALEFTILTAARNGESRGAKWDEIDMEAATWTVPGERMKGGRMHRVPLSARALAILEAVKPLSVDGLVFPGLAKGKPISEAAVRKLLNATLPDVTTHGFRSTFRDWCAEMTAYPREVAEAALAHVLRNKVEAAYRRGDIFEKRRKLMQAWADYLASRKQAGVVPIKRKV